MTVKAYADGVPVYCEHTKIVPIEDVIPNPKNDNVHPETQIRFLSKIIRTHGWRAPITISTRSGLISRGEGRYLSARFNGWKEVPVDYQHYETEAEELADLKADNRLMDFSRFDPTRERELVSELMGSGVSPELIGYSPEEIEVILAEPDIDEFFKSPPPDPNRTQDQTTIIQCPACGGQYELEN